MSFFLLLFLIFWLPYVLSIILDFISLAGFDNGGKGTNDPDTPTNTNKSTRSIPKSIGIWLFLEIYQQAAQYLLRFFSLFTDNNLTKIRLIFYQGISLGLLKVLTLIPQKKLLFYNASSGLDISAVETAFTVILTQSVMKPIMKVFSFTNIRAYARIAWVRLRLLFGSVPLLTQEEYNAIYTKPKCYLQKLYCEDIYITTIALVSSAYNPGATVACLFYFIIKTFTDRIFFLRFYGEPEIDSTLLSKKYFTGLLTVIKVVMFIYLRKSYNVGVPSEGPFYVLIYTIKLICFVQICIPFEFAVRMIHGILERRRLVNRTEKSEELLEVGEKNSEIGKEGDELLLNQEYYKGVSSLALTKQKFDDGVLGGVYEVSFISNSQE